MVKYRIKFLSRHAPDQWQRYFPNGDGIWRQCQFVFDSAETDYDWLVVYDDIAPDIGNPRYTAKEVLHCHPNNTLLITTEPESIKTYGRRYTSQFGHVLTSQPAWALPHRSRYYQLTMNHWFYGYSKNGYISYSDIQKGPSASIKSDAISIVHSNKRMRHTLHARRYDFIEFLRKNLAGLKVFGRGYMPLNDKREALDSFRYHIAIENHVAHHHITEKLIDGFLGRCLVFYAGAPNASDYFPENSFISININDPEGAVETIRSAIQNDEWERRKDVIEQARNMVLQKYNIFQAIEKITIDNYTDRPREKTKTIIKSRHFMRRNLLTALIFTLEKIQIRIIIYIKKITGLITA